MGSRVDHWHRCLVPVDVVPLTEGVNDVQLDVGKGSEGVEDETSEVLHALKMKEKRNIAWCYKWDENGLGSICVPASH